MVVYHICLEKKLKVEGFKVARRTVAKYREQENIVNLTMMVDLEKIKMTYLQETHS